MVRPDTDSESNGGDPVPEETQDGGVDPRLVRIHDLEAALEAARLEERRLRAGLEAVGGHLRHYRELFDFAPVPCLALDRAGIIELANLHAAELLGVPRGVLEGRPLLGCVSRETQPALLEHLRRCRAGDTPARSEIELLCRASESRGEPVGGTESDPASDRGSGARATIPVEVHSHCRADDTRYFLTTLIDLTDRKRAEAERERVAEAQAVSQAKDRFVATLSHELRTPLSPIANLLEVLRLRTDLPDNVGPILEMMQRNLWLEVRLIDDLLDATRIARNKLRLEPEDLDLHQTLRQVAEMVEGDFRDGGVALSLQPEATESGVHADPTRLNQVFWNLLRNAVKFTPSGGRVGVRTFNPEPGRIKVVVEDNGEGIDPELVNQLFEPFEQVREAHRGGLGLGLAIAKGVIEAHGGRIGAYSEGPGKGSTFVVTLPLSTG